MATKSSFHPVKRSTHFRTIARSAGEVGTGKTHFWLTGPKPVFVQSIDQGMEGTVDQLLESGVVKEGEIQLAEYDWSPGDITVRKLAKLTDNEAIDLKAHAIALRDRFIADYYEALKHARTIMWDKESDIWQLFRYAEFGASTGGMPQHSDDLNLNYTALINKAKDYNVSLGLIQSVKDEWGAYGDVNQKTGKRGLSTSGRRVPSGYKRLGELVFMEIEHKRVNGEFMIAIGKCRQNTALQDDEFPAMSFAEFGQLLIPGSEESDWT